MESLRPASNRYDPMPPMPAGEGVPPRSTRLSLIETLRASTKDLHERLEADLDWERRMATRDGYAQMLARWWGFHAVYEPMADGRPAFVSLEGRARLGLIESDLLHLGHAPAAIAVLPRISPLTYLRDRAGMIGAMYVMEGSTLGGQLIARHVERHLGPDIHQGACAYFQGYGKTRTMPMWRAFLACLDGVDEELHAGAVLGARRTFSALRDWLSD